MALLGAKNNTEKELFDGLRYSLGFSNSDEVHSFFKKLIDSFNANDSDVTLNVVNKVLVHKTDGFEVNEEYVKQLQTIYNAKVDPVNFRTESNAIVKSCNEWVNNATKGKIPSILDQLDDRQAAIVLNAIYFKGSWQNRFDEKNTKNLIFYNFGEKQKVKCVPLMFMNDAKGSLYSTTIDGEELRMLELPYKGDVSLNILLPKSLNGLKKIEESLSYDIIEKMKIVSREVDNLWLPKFKMDTSYALVDKLKLMGVNEAFSDNADFGGIREQKDIKISKIIHKASIEVNEEGTVAAAVTAVGFVCTSAREVIEFRVDHPFAYFVKDTKSEIILFAGSVYEL